MGMHRQPRKGRVHCQLEQPGDGRRGGGNSAWPALFIMTLKLQSTAEQGGLWANMCELTRGIESVRVGHPRETVSLHLND